MKVLTVRFLLQESKVLTVLSISVKHVIKSSSLRNIRYHPCQAVCNQLQVFELPQRLSDVNRLERVLVAKRILFKKVVIMPKGMLLK